MNRYIHTILCIAFSLMLPFASTAQAPVANFSANVTSGCSPILVNFTDLSTNTPTSWYWDLGNGSTSTLQNPSTTYINPGLYTIVLTATNASGNNTKTVTGYINVSPTPVVSFTADSTPSCILPRTITFTNNSIPGGSGTTTYLWDFGDGTTSTAQNPTKTYTVAGNYSVVLLVTNGTGCTGSLSKTNYINIAAKPVANFVADNSIGCTTPFTVTFTNNSTSGATYNWDFGDGGSSTATTGVHAYNASGTYSVRLITTSAAGCKDTMLKAGYIIIGKPAAGFTTSSSSICSRRNITFTNTSTPLGYTSSWDFGDGNTSVLDNPVKSYTTAGTYTVRLIVQRANCADTAFQTVTVAASPIANFSGTPLLSCTTPLTTVFTNTSTGAATYAWYFDDGNTSTSANPSNTYIITGSFNIRLIATASNGCADTIQRNDYVKVKVPVGTITTNNYSGCAPVTVNFTSTNTSVVPVTGYSWNFGDATSVVTCGSCNTQSHTYAAPGTYTVTLTYTTGTSCTFTATKTVIIGSKPTAAFTAVPTTICPEQTVTFTNSSTGATGYTWLFGDGGTSTLANPTYNGYQYPGSSSAYTVTLIANNNGCKDTLVKSNYITVNPPLAKFKLVPNCANRANITLIDSSIGADTYAWDWGDGNTSTQIGGTLTHTYAAAGNYTAKLTVTNTATGCTHTMTKVVNVFALAPSFSANDTTLCPSDTALFTAIADTNIVNYAWNFGDAFPGSGAANAIKHAYAAGGIYPVKLVITDKLGCKDSITKSPYMRVGGATVAFSATPTIGCVPLLVNFTDASVPNGGFSINNRLWDYGYGPSVSLGATSSNFNYTNTGVWTVNLRIFDANGCVTSLKKIDYITVGGAKAQFFTNDTVVCAGNPVVINNNSGGNNFTNMWYWGDNTTSTQLTPTHVYNNPGLYTIKLVITDAIGCKDSSTRTDYVSVQKPVVDFTLSDTAANCPPLAVNVTSTSTSVTSYAWSFGNAGVSSLPNPSTLYTYPGTYHIKLIGSTAGGCKDSITKDVVVHGPTGVFSYTPTSGCSPITVSFSATTTGASQLIWDMSNGFTQTTTANSYTYTYTQPGKYVPKLILSDGASCLVPIQGIDTVKVDHTDADFSFPATTYCGASTVQFTDTILSTLSPVATRSWTFGDGGTSTAHNPSHAYAGGGTYTVMLIVKNTQGCADTTVKTVVIKALPNVSAANDQTICQGNTTAVTVTATGATTYSWTPSTGLSCTNCAAPTALPSATTTYVVTGTDNNGCTDTGSVVITVAPKPNVSAAGTTTICLNGFATLTASGATSYVWTPATALSCTACASTVATPTVTTTYIVTGTDGNGCTDTGMAVVTLSPQPTVSAGANVAICIGASTTLNAVGGTSYTWTPATGLSCTSCASPVATPTTTTTYTVTGNNASACSNTATVTVTVNPKPTVGAGSPVAICNGSSTTLTGTGATSYAWSPSTGLSCTGCTSPVASPATSTTYTVTGTDGNGCVNTSTVAVTVNAKPTVTASPDVTICNGNTTTLTGYGATSYVWSPSTGLSCSSCTSPTASPAAATTYTVTGTDGNGCNNTANVTVSVNAKPIVSAGLDVAICAGNSTILNGTGAVSYTWSPSTGLSCAACASPVATPAATTTYTVTGTNAAGCVNTATVTVTVNPKPTVGAGSNVAICSGSSTTLTGTGATTYTWSPATGLSCTSCTSPVATPTTTTTYTVTGTNGCTSTANVTVTVNAKPTVSAGSNVTICDGSSTTLTGTGAATYTWSPATALSCISCTAPIANPGTTTAYTVTGTDANGCTNTATVTVSVNPKPSVSAGSNQTICAGSAATLTASGTVSYVWSPSAGLSCTACANPSASPAATTVYTVTGTDANGCTNTSNVTVNVNPKPAVVTNANIAICAGSSTTLTASGATSYVWSPAATLSCAACAAPVATPALTTTYIVTGTNANGCVNTANVTVTVNPIPAVVASGAKTICVGESAQLNVTGATSYSWTPGTALSCVTCNNPIASPATTITYTVTGTTSGCSASAAVTVTVRPQPVITISGDKDICIGATTSLLASGAATYTWTPSNGLSCNNCANPNANPTTTTNYAIKGVDGDGCSNTANVTVTVNPLPVIDAGADQTICNGSTAYLSVTGGVIYTWSGSTPLSCVSCPNPTVTPTTKTTYTVRGTDANGCSNSDDVTVSVVDKGSVEVGPGAEICKGETAQLHASGGTSYLWSPATGLSDPAIPDPLANPEQTTDYKLIMKQGDCFVDTSTVTVTVHDLPAVELGPDLFIAGGNSVTLFAKTNMTVKYAWTPAEHLSCTDCAAPVATPFRTVTYTAEVTSDFGCKAKDDITVHVTCDNSQIFVANTFTPNEDGVNDRFYPQGKGITTLKTFKVYNRWGEVLFSRDNMPLNDPDAGWDGKYMGAQMKPDVFVYILTAYCESGELLNLKGDISLIR